MAASMDDSDAVTKDLSGPMSGLRIRPTKPSGAPVLDDFMKCHVYIGYSWEDREPVKELHTFLTSKGLTCSLRSGLDVKEQAQPDNIKQGVIFSHKCLLYISPNYLKDSQSQRELKEAKRKLQLLGKNSVFGIVNYNVTEEQLEGYKQFQLIFLSVGQTVLDCLSNSQYWDAILNDYGLNPQLSLVPKENFGVGVAYTYFFSFLRMVIPGVRQQVLEEIRNSRLVKESTDKKFLVKKMLIIIPETLRSPQKFTDDTNIKKANLFIKQCYNRAGKENREYTVPIYELTDEKKNVYYFVTDIPSCLFAIREAYDSMLTNMPKDDIVETRNDFVLTVKALLKHQAYQAEFADQWEMLLWSDDDEGKTPMKLSEFVSQQIKGKGLAVKLDDALKLKEPITDSANRPEDKGNSRSVRGVSQYPMYLERSRYALKNALRGHCVILSNNCFLKDLGARKCAVVEINKLKKLFKELKFEVHTHCNLSADDMKVELAKYNEMDHSKCDAFVCCLLSHGSKGRIFGTEGIEDSVSVVELMKFFYDDKCPTLTGKPKLFFIGACQSQGSVAGDTEPGTALQSSSATPVSPDAGPGVSSESSNIKTDAVPEEHSGNVMRDLVPTTVDFIVSYACLPYTQAIRNEEKGGYYVQALCKHLKRDLEIDVALRNVNQEVRDLWDEDIKDGGQRFARPDPFHIIMPPQKFFFLNSSC